IDQVPGTTVILRLLACRCLVDWSRVILSASLVVLHHTSLACLNTTRRQWQLGYTNPYISFQVRHTPEYLPYNSSSANTNLVLLQDTPSHPKPQVAGGPPVATSC
ncbi:unnamed protein product, partial [Sphacelaria rigidula]